MKDLRKKKFQGKKAGNRWREEHYKPNEAIDIVPCSTGWMHKECWEAATKEKMRSLTAEEKRLKKAKIDVDFHEDDIPNGCAIYEWFDQGSASETGKSSDDSDDVETVNNSKDIQVPEAMSQDEESEEVEEKIKKKRGRRRRKGCNKKGGD